MPNAPILSRTRFYDKLPDGSMRLLDFALVNTSLGAMIEPQPVELASELDATSVRPLQERSFDRLEELDENLCVRLFNTGIDQVPSNYRA